MNASKTLNVNHCRWGEDTCTRVCSTWLRGQSWFLSWLTGFFSGLGFRGLGFRGLGFRGLGFRGLGFRV